jgi:hypothetical protein
MFHLTFEESINKRDSIGSCWYPTACTSITEKSLQNTPDRVLEREKFFEFFLAIAKETYFSILLEKIPFC